jgi:hypothetical protein
MLARVYFVEFYQETIKQLVLGRNNLPTFPMAMVAVVTLAKDCM